MQRIGLWVVAVTSIIAAILLIYTAGLPDRSAYTGFVIDGLGYVAPEEGQIAPPFHVDLLSGEEIDLFDLRGEWIIVNFWATWCVPCAIEMPELQMLYDDIDVRIIGINISETRAPIEAWVTEFELTFDIAFDRNQTIYAMYRVRGQPSTYVIDPNGIITEIFYGATTADTLRSIIDT